MRHHHQACMGTPSGHVRRQRKACTTTGSVLVLYETRLLESLGIGFAGACNDGRRIQARRYQCRGSRATHLPCSIAS